MPESLMTSRVRAEKAWVGNMEGYLIMVGPVIAFGMVKEDLDPLSEESLEEAANKAAERLQAVLQARADQRSLPLLLRGIALSLAASAGLILVLWLAARARRRLIAWLDSSPLHLARFKFLEIDLRPQALAVERRLIGLGSWALWLSSLYLWITYVLGQFPYTQPWGETLGSYLVATLSRLASGAIAALPSLGTVVIIFLVTRFLAQLISNLFLQVEIGKLEVSWMLPETARATRRLAVVVIWLFALTVAYPHIPGSDSEAFKGLSVLVGLMISLGSAGLVNQVMSGFVVLFSRAIRTGDYVRIGEVEGIVTELGTLSTKVVTPRKEEITIPNALLIGTTTTNYSRLAAEDGAIVPTTVTIGYDAPWRQVHALLLLAAERTAGVRKQPRPRVMQKALSDFYVEYVLLVHIDRAEDRLPVLSELHAQIQDAFNEFGVQIMSPHFEKQPKNTVTVPPANWHAPPANSIPGEPSPAPTQAAAMV
jgi:small-conductance mechanosensitive channel